MEVFMPYQKKDELPEAVKGLPEHAQEIWMAAFNSAWDQYSKSPLPQGEGQGEGGLEERCFATAWAAVKNRYRKDGDEWIAIESKFAKGMIPLVILKEIPIKGQDAPGEFQILPYGKIDIEGDLPAYVDEESIRMIIAYQSHRGNDMVIDYEH
jgi:cation transport regulator